jgi:phenylpropionate dioxygenase-like ring-hydroxylating dioxygenase large terminal subunit
MGRDTIPVDPYYTSKEFYEREIDRIFKQDWLVVGREEEIPNAGDYKVKRLDFADVSAILIRGKDKVIRAFHNICRHRGNKVITEVGGNETFGSNRAAVMTCRFHGWVYDAQGALVSVPREEALPGSFCREQNALVPIHVDTWNGFIFVNLAQTPPKGLKEFLGGVVDHLKDYPFHQMTHVHTYSAHLNCNWKIGIDAFSEGYHVPTIHAGSFPGLTSYWLGDLQFHGDHHSIAFFATGLNPPTTVSNIANERFASSIAMARTTSFSLPKTVNPTRNKQWGFELTTLFPNYLLHVGEGLWFVHQFWPTSHDSCLWEGSYYLPKPTRNSHIWAQRYAVLLQRNAWLEDTATMEDTHTALRAGAVKYVNFSDEEVLLRHQYEVVMRRVAG